MTKAQQVFGAPLKPEQAVFRLNDSYVLWLILDVKGNLEEVNVGPRSYYSSEFPGTKKPSDAEYLSANEYQEALQRIGELKDVGTLQQSHGSSTTSTDFGQVNTDRFEHAFVDRIVKEEVEGVRRFNVYFLQEMAGSPERLSTMDEEPMICFVGLWYYLAPDDTKNVHVGTWQKLQAAGPNLHGTTGCVRTAVLHDADGFIIEEPQNETIVLDDIHARELTGQVHLSNSPLDGVNVEFKRKGSKEILRARTNARGNFSISGVHDGEYRFKVTKDGFKSLSGTVFVDRSATRQRLSFELPVGT